MNRTREKPHPTTPTGYILLHEYIHTVGYTDEAMTRRKIRDQRQSTWGTRRYQDGGRFSQYFHMTYIVPEQPLDPT